MNEQVINIARLLSPWLMIPVLALSWYIKRKIMDQDKAIEKESKDRKDDVKSINTRIDGVCRDFDSKLEKVEDDIKDDIKELKKDMNDKIDWMCRTIMERIDVVHKDLLR